MIFGHFTTSFLCFKFLRPKYTTTQLVAGSIASYLPDILDKCLYFAHFTHSSRTFGHHLLFPYFLAGCAYVWRKNINLEILTLGVIFHQFQDCSPLALWLWPMAGPIESMPNYSMLESLKRYYSFKRQTLEIWIELLGHCGFLYYLLKNKNRGRPRCRIVCSPEICE